LVTSWKELDDFLLDVLLQLGRELFVKEHEELGYADHSVKVEVQKLTEDLPVFLISE